MSETRGFLTIGSGEAARDIAWTLLPGDGPGLVWLAGFQSDMASTKASVIADWAQRAGRACLRFDYSGHGISGGRFIDGTVGRWLEESLAVFRARTAGPQILVGSSMGGWIALLVARALRALGETDRLAGLVLIAPAVDFTEALIWQRLPDDIRREIETTGVWRRPTPYATEPQPITLGLIEEGRNHLLLDQPVRAHAPVHILQGMRDDAVPWRHAMRLVEGLAEDSVTLSLIKDGDHRLSRDGDLALLIRAVEGIGC